MSEITAWIMDLMRTHGAMTVFIGVIIESVIVPIPSPLIIMGAGAILVEPGLTWAQCFMPMMMKIVIPGAVASTLGAYIIYGLAYWGGRPAIERYHRFLGFGWHDVERMEKWFNHRMGLAIFVLRALPIVPLSLISAAAGVIRLPVFIFTIWTFLGSLPRCLILGYLGYLTRDTYEGIAHRLNSLESLISGAIVILAFALIFYFRSRMQRND